MQKRKLEITDLTPDNKFVLVIFHYGSEGGKRRFVLPRIVSGDWVLVELKKLSANHNVFKTQFYFSNFEHYEQIFNEMIVEHDDWRTRLDAIERRVPYLTSSLASPKELETLYVD